jgi:hypothetical protein
MIYQKGPWVFNNEMNSGYLDVPYLVLERDSRHFFRKYRGFSISRDVFEYAKSKKIRFYEIHYLPSMMVFIFNLDDFRTGHTLYFSGELQYVLPVHRALSQFIVPKFRPDHIDTMEVSQ